MEKVKVKDFLVEVGEEGVQAVLESDYVSEAVTAICDIVTTEGMSLLIGSVVGAVAPRINNIRLNCMEKAFERRVEKALECMNARVKNLEQRYECLNDEMQEKFRGIYVEWFLNNLYEEKQIEKIVYHVNGYINMMDNSANDNIMIMFLNTLSDLTNLDIDVLKLYSNEREETAWGLLERYGMLPEQLVVIKEKLARYGLLYSRLDDFRDDNIDAIATYLLACEKEAKKNKPGKVSMRNIQKPKKTETYSITPLGRDFLNKIVS